MTTDLADQCVLAGQSMQQATQALLDTDAALAERVISAHTKRAAHASSLEHDALTLLALQAPVAGDLRTVVACLKNVADAERMAALSRHVAEIARRRHPSCAVPGHVVGYFADMGRLAVNLGNNAAEVVRFGDPRKAAHLRHDDDAVDRLHRQLFSVMLSGNWHYDTAATVDVTLLGRYYERFADHAVEIGRRVIFQITGTTRT